MFGLFDAAQSCVHLTPYAGVPTAKQEMPKTEHDPSPETEVHMAHRLEEYAAGSLDPAREVDVESHLLVCDTCFAAYVALLVKRE
jgi:hypothetical protein